jgi:uncharacterized membrane protein
MTLTNTRTTQSNPANITHTQASVIPAAPQRWTSIDLLRGCALLAMLITHSAWRIPDFDYRAAYGWDTPLIPDMSMPHVILGWFLQGSSPIFFLLAGFAIAFFCHSRRTKGWTKARISRYLLIRGLVLVVLDLTIMNIDTEPLAYGYRLSVLTAMGINMWLIACLWWLNWRWIALLAVSLLLGTQTLYYLHGIPQGDWLLRALLLAPGGKEHWLVLFPALPWLPVMLFGLVSGELLIGGKIRLPDYAIGMGIFLLILSLVIDLNAGYGNLYPADPFIFGKHPPDLMFIFVYLSLGFLLLGLYQHLSPLYRTLPVRILIQFGQTSLFFYIVHTRLLLLASYIIPGPTLELPPLAYSLVLVTVTLPILFLLCRGYQQLRSRYPNSVLQYL